ncbi:MAG: CotH kinase family protein [Lachnospiraceae bacterium]|nr:CotH kinase family protein [Lachnospiraceae bacterium]
MKTKHSLLLPVILTGVVLLSGCSGKDNQVTPTQAPDTAAVTSQLTPTPGNLPGGNQGSSDNNNQNPNGNQVPDGSGLPADGQNGDWGDWGNWGGNRVTPTPVPVVTIPAEDPVNDKTNTSVKENTEPVDVKLGFGDDGNYAFAEANTFYTQDVRLTITAPYESTIYYTLDGSEPTAESSIYTEPLVFKAHGSRFPEAAILRVKVLDINGNWSKTAARTYLAGTKLDGRFTTVVFSISGNPGDLTEGPDGIFYGTNYEQRGRESERMVHIEAWRADGTNLIDQYGGVRIYGGYNRQATLKSMKLFSRKSYDEDNKNFKFSEFNTMKLDGSENIIKKYDKLVLRNCGNDNQFAFIRDELSQRLVQLAGFECYEQVIPAVAYLNGQYYNLFWLHESYCDKYFKEKFGDAEGEFIILEGEDTIKKDDDDPATQVEVEAYNKAYNEFINSDLTDDSVYKKLCDFMDVEDYLNFFAWNICLNNWDWPNNNFKCYRYVEASDSVLSQEGAITTPTTKYYDGRWRFLPHDMDYTYGLYGQDKTQANYNTLRVVMNKNNVRYSPLFTKLMDRKDCRSYFRAKCLEYCNGPLSEESIISTYKKLHAERVDELEQYYLFLERMRRLGEDSLWTTASNYQGNEDQIFEFARDRAGYILRYLDELLPELE